VHKALAANGAPAGTLNVIMGNSHKVMNEWLSSEFVNDIVHFGNSKQGFELGKQMYAAGKKPILELSGNDVFVVWRDADLETACESLLEGFLGSTQICMVPKIAVVHKDIYADFSKAMVQRVKQLRVSLPSDPETVLSPVAKIREFYEFRDDALAKGASLLCGGERVNYRDEEDPQGSYIRPALLKVPDLKEALGMKMLREEIFFPLMPLVRVNGSDDAVAAQIISLINNHAYGLRVSLWVRSPKYLRRFAKEIDNCGLLRINSRHVGFSFYLSTHGGTRRSGGPFGEMNYFWQKTSHLQGVTRTV
jgi:acyl-CoA reductase-like NAD-dependent aldehyde dehydrogenase